MQLTRFIPLGMLFLIGMVSDVSGFPMEGRDLFLRINLDALNSTQRADVDALRELLKNEAASDYMTSDFFLTILLVKSGFNVEASAKHFREYMDWRTQLKLDTILEEDWSDMRAKFPYTYHNRDKDDKPLVYMDVGEWEVCSFLAESPSSSGRLTRYMLMFLEELETLVRTLRNQGLKTKNYRLIVNAGGLTKTKHVCAEHGKVIRDLTNDRTKYGYPSENKAFLFNVPNSFKTLFSLIGEQTQNSLELYGQDRSEWEAQLLKTIARDQLPAGIFKEPVEKDNSEGRLQWHHEL